MIEETYSAAFLASRTVLADGRIAARGIGWVRVAATELMKSVVRTPMKGGHVDYDAVPSGASVWVTVSDSSSPLHGRPILISKRPDGQFALEGGSGVSHWHDDPQRENKIAARRHLVLSTKPKAEIKADRQQEQDRAKGAQKNEERATAKAARDDAAKQTRAAVGITDDQRLGRKERDAIAGTAASKLQEHGLSEEEANAAARHLPVAVQEARNRVVAHHVARRVDTAHGTSGGRMARTDDHQPAQDQRSAGFKDRDGDLPAHEASSVAVSHAGVAQAVRRAKTAKGGDLSTPEMEQAVKDSVHGQVDRKLATPDTDDDEQGDLKVADVPAWNPGTAQEAKGAIDAFGREAQARGMKTGDVTPDEVANGGQQALAGKAIDRSIVDAEGLSDGAYDTLMDQYRKSAAAPQAGAFYRALGEHWSSPHDYAASLSGHVARGAAAGMKEVAAYGLSTGDIDIPDLVDRLGVDAAAHVLAAHALAQKSGDGQAVDTLVRSITASGGRRIAAVEQEALNRHAEHQKEAGALTRALDSAPGSGAGGTVRRAELQAALALNINGQRANLGGALGHMQMRATFLHALERFGKAMKSGTGSEGVPVALTFGDDERAADEAAQALRLPQGAFQKTHDIRHGWTLQVDAARMKEAARAASQRGKELAQARETQADDQPAGDYRVPGQADQMPDGAGGHASVNWTPMQRNDIDFLHQSGGGVLMGAREGGKRIAALGWLARQAADNPNFKAVVTTDEGGARQWHGLAGQRFPNLRTMSVPQEATPRDVTQAIRDLGNSQGGVLVLPHGAIGERHHSQIARMADEGRLHGHVMENPPSGGTGLGHALTDAGHALSMATAETGVRRVALHDRHPIEAPELGTQLAHWAHPDKVSAADLRKARETAGSIGVLTPATAGAIHRQIVSGMASSVAAAPFKVPGASEQPQDTLRRVRAEERQAAHPPKGESEERVEWRQGLEAAVRDGNDGEAQAMLDLAHHYGYEPEEARKLYSDLTGEGTESNGGMSDAAEIESIESSPFFQAFEHLNANSKVKRTNPLTGKRILGRDKKTGRVGVSTEEPYETAGSGYDVVSSGILAAHEGGHSQQYGMDNGEFWRQVETMHRRYTELKRRQPQAEPEPPPEKPKRAIIAGGRSKANTPVGTLPNTPKPEMGGTSYTPITMQPEDAAGGNVAPTNRARPAPSVSTPEVPFKLEMQYGGLPAGQTQAIKEEEAGQRRMDMGVPQVRARKSKLRKALPLILLRRP